MSVVTEIERIKQGVENAISAVEYKGVEVPEKISINDLHTYVDKIKEFQSETITDGRHLFLNNRFIRYADMLDYQLTGDCTGMFQGVIELNLTDDAKLDLNTIDTSNITSMQEMFRDSNCKSSIDSPGIELRWITSNVTNMNAVFYDYAGDYLDIHNFVLSNVTNLCSMFAGATITDRLILPQLDFTNATNLSYMFYNCTNGSEQQTHTIGTNRFDILAATDITSMFEDCNLLPEHITVSAPNYTIENCGAFLHNSSVKYLTLENFTVKKGGMILMQIVPKDIIGLDIMSADLSKATNSFSFSPFMNAFSGCTELQHITGLENITIGSIRTIQGMFKNCTSLIGTLNVTWIFNKLYNFTSTTQSNTQNAFANVFENCASLFGIEGIHVKILVNDATIKLFGSTLNTSIENVFFQDYEWTDAENGTLDMTPLAALNVDTVANSIPTYQGTAVKTLIFNTEVYNNMTQAQKDIFAAKNITITYGEPS